MRPKQAAKLGYSQHKIARYETAAVALSSAKVRNLQQKAWYLGSKIYDKGSNRLLEDSPLGIRRFATHWISLFCWP